MATAMNVEAVDLAAARSGVVETGSTPPTSALDPTPEPALDASNVASTRIKRMEFLERARDTIRELQAVRYADEHMPGGVEYERRKNRILRSCNLTSFRTERLSGEPWQETAVMGVLHARKDAIVVAGCGGGKGTVMLVVAKMSAGVTLITVALSAVLRETMERARAFGIEVYELKRGDDKAVNASVLEKIIQRGGTSTPMIVVMQVSQSLLFSDGHVSLHTSNTITPILCSPKCWRQWRCKRLSVNSD